MDTSTKSCKLSEKASLSCAHNSSFNLKNCGSSVCFIFSSGLIEAVSFNVRSTRVLVHIIISLSSLLLSSVRVVAN